MLTNGGKYLLEALAGLNFCSEGFNGATAYSWTDIQNYGKMQKYLNDEELILLRQMSVEFVRGYRRAEDPTSIAPHEERDFLLND